MTITIKNIHLRTIHTSDHNNFRRAVEEAVAMGISLAGANLRYANLTDADLSWAILTRSGVYRTDSGWRN